jgi:hypothetical protein
MYYSKDELIQLINDADQNKLNNIEYLSEVEITLEDIVDIFERCSLDYKISYRR